MEVRDQGCSKSSQNRWPIFAEAQVLVQSNSPYKGGTFHFTLTLPENFPFKPPSVCPSFPVRYASRLPGVLHVPSSTCS